MTTRFHISISLRRLELQSDGELCELIAGPDGERPTADEIRAEISEMRNEGLRFMPCACADHNDDGSCKGWEVTATK